MTAVAKQYPPVKMQNPKGEVIDLRLAISSEEHQRGLSGLKPSQFGFNEGMLFISEQMSPKKFWMPDTYFALDIIFLDQNLTIVGIEKNVPFHPGFQEPPEIYRTKIYQAQHVLECKSGSPFTSLLKVGDKLKFIGSKNLLETKLKTRLFR